MRIVAHKRLLRVVWVVPIAACLAAGAARAAEVTRVVSALDEENRADFNVTLSWLHDAKSAFIKRESVTPTGPELIKDSKFNQTVDWLNLRGTFEFLKVSEAQDRTRYTIGVEPFINHVLQPRIQYRINNAPANQPGLNHDELWLELHVFL